MTCLVPGLGREPSEAVAQVFSPLSIRGPCLGRASAGSQLLCWTLYLSYAVETSRQPCKVGIRYALQTRKQAVRPSTLPKVTVRGAIGIWACWLKSLPFAQPLPCTENRGLGRCIVLGLSTQGKSKGTRGAPGLARSTGASGHPFARPVPALVEELCVSKQHSV